jgi:hypothetical protein
VYYLTFQLVNELVLIGIRAGQQIDFLEALNHEDLSAGTLLSVFVATFVHMFLCLYNLQSSVAFHECRNIFCTRMPERTS